MTDLYKYLYRDVIIIDIDGTTWDGHVVSFDFAEDNDDNEDSIIIQTPKEKGVLIDFSQSEIKSIELA